MFRGGVSRFGVSPSWVWVQGFRVWCFELPGLGFRVFRGWGLGFGCFEDGVSGSGSGKGWGGWGFRGLGFHFTGGVFGVRGLGFILGLAGWGFRGLVFHIMGGVFADLGYGWCA